MQSCDLSRGNSSSAALPVHACDPWRAANLTRVFGMGRTKTSAVNIVDYNFYAGEVISIVGESGSGRTTMNKMLLDLINETEGEIYFLGQKRRDISSQKKKQEYWKNIQAIFQVPFSPYTIFNKIDDVWLDLSTVWFFLPCEHWDYSEMWRIRRMLADLPPGWIVDRVRAALRVRSIYVTFSIKS